MSDLFCASKVVDPNVMFGPNATTAQSSIFSVSELPVVLTVSGLTGSACVTVESVFGCGSGDTFEPLNSGCGETTTLTPCQTTTVVAITGRYRLVLNDPTGAITPSDITVYARETNIPLSGGSSMSNCGGCVGTDPNSHASATVTSADGVLNVTQTGQAFTLDFNPVVAAAEFSASPAAQAVLAAALCDDLKPCVTAVVAPLLPTTLPPSGAAGGGLTGTYPNPGLSPTAVQAAMGPAGGGLTGTYPNPGLSGPAVVTATGFTNCSGSPLNTGAPLATCGDLTAAIAAIPPNPTTLPPSGAAGGSLTGTYPNPGLNGGAVVTATGFTNCSGSPLTTGIPLATCGDLTAAIAAIPPNPTTLPPSGAAGGALTGTYPNPGIDGASAATALAFVDCGAAPITAGTSLATCANLNAAIAGIPAGPSTLPPSGPAGGDLAGTYPNPTVIVATDTVKGKVALNTGSNLPADSTNNVDALTGAGFNAIASDPAGPNATQNAIAAAITEAGLPLSTDAGQLLTLGSDGKVYSPANKTVAGGGIPAQGAVVGTIAPGITAMGSPQSVTITNPSTTRPMYVTLEFTPAITLYTANTGGPNGAAYTSGYGEYQINGGGYTTVGGASTVVHDGIPTGVQSLPGPSRIVPLYLPPGASAVVDYRAGLQSGGNYSVQAVIGGLFLNYTGITA